MLGEAVDSVATETATHLTTVDAADRRTTMHALHERARNDTGLLVAALRADAADATHAIRADLRTAADTFMYGKVFHHIPLGVALAGMTVTTNAVVELDGSTDSITAYIEGFLERGSSDLLTIAELQHIEAKAPKTIAQLCKLVRTLRRKYHSGDMSVIPSSTTLSAQVAELTIQLAEMSANAAAVETRSTGGRKAIESRARKTYSKFFDQTVRSHTKGKKICYAWNQGLPCDAATCKFNHVCARCGEDARRD